MAAHFELEGLIMQLYDDNMVDVEDVLLLLDAQWPRRNLHMEQPYWQYPAFDLERSEYHECLVDFRFTKGKIYKLLEAFELPKEIRCYNSTVMQSVEALCITPKRFAYPCRYVDLILRFTRTVSHLCMASNLITDEIFNRFQHLLTSMNQPGCLRQHLQSFADAIHNKEAALESLRNTTWRATMPQGRLSTS